MFSCALILHWLDVIAFSFYCKWIFAFSVRQFLRSIWISKYAYKFQCLKSESACCLNNRFYWSNYELIWITTAANITSNPHWAIPTFRSYRNYCLLISLNMVGICNYGNMILSKRTVWNNSPNSDEMLSALTEYV